MHYASVIHIYEETPLNTRQLTAGSFTLITWHNSECHLDILDFTAKNRRFASSAPESFQFRLWARWIPHGISQEHSLSLFSYPFECSALKHCYPLLRLKIPSMQVRKLLDYLLGGFHELPSF